ncbi:hypothetical protein [Williamsoniiplasma luminosum]|uniref:Uncharacterized protein n=1 Tax=Williamsoniiplasma luminosum TaxID=214888 RepID=A0A2S0NKE5_9MOLU|nr:hypothetical protein [Williamsoniiplasma luminosum]AVP49490.1 MAG: hypothetical protein C5T88_02845 [Williamsoniiplasma luminosum]
MMNLFLNDPLNYIATKIITSDIWSRAEGETPKPPVIKPALEFMQEWGFWILGIISAIALIACAIYLAIDGMKFYRATSADERNQIKNNMIGKVIGAIIAVSGTVIFNVLASVLTNKP